MKLAALLLTASALAPYAARAEAPADTVRGYFQALEHKDFGRALALTEGDAMKRTARMLGTLYREAHAAHADVELKVQKLELAEQKGEGTIPVEVTFDIDVIGKKWIFKRVARHLTGTAQFYVATASPSPHIVAITGNLY